VGNKSRQKQLVELITQQRECSIEQLAKQFDVSEMTIRRDLQSLSENGKIIRTHGGATIGERVTFEFEFLNRVQQHQAEKEAIATLAATKITDGQSVMLDSGTTTLALAGQLEAKKGLTVITTSLPIASRLQFCPDVEVLLLGGYVRASSPDLGGAITESNLESLCADVAFIGAHGIDGDGVVYQQTPETGRMAAKMVRAAKQVYVLADSTKYGRVALCKFGRLQDWAGLITDQNIDKAALKILRAAGVQVFTAEV
jgi:DeoR family transcriptional regulator, fructose operon transcriptional repressor